MSWLNEGHRCLVTGGSAGIGLETARGLAGTGATVVITGRSAERSEAAVAQIRASTGNDRVSVIRADFSSLSAVRALAAEVSKQGAELDVLVNNAGLWHPDRQLSEDGFEDTFAVNYLAPFVLTQLLLPTMIPATRARIVHVSSRLHRKAKGMKFDDLQLERRYPRKGLAAYEQSKLGNILFSNELARRLPSHITSNAVHPGSVATNVTRGSRIARWGQAVIRPFLRNATQGAATSLHVAMSAEVDAVTGAYFSSSRRAEPSRFALDEAAAAHLWQLSLELGGVDDATVRE